MKILFLTINLGNGGAERVLVNLANELARRGHDITLRVLADYGSNKELLSEDVKYSYVFKHAFRGMNYLHLLPHNFIYNRIVDGRYDVVIPYLHGVLTRIVAYAPQSQKTIAYLHADMEKSPFMLNLKRRNKVHACFDSYNKIVSVSQSVQDSFIRTTGINDDRLAVIYNTFDTNGIIDKAKDNIPDVFESGSLKLCSVGKLEDVKGYLRLLNVACRLRNDGIKCSLVIVGEGAQRTELEHFIKEHSMESYAGLVGFDINPYKYIAHSDLFVCSSYTEGFSSVVAESLILGVPVLTTDCAGMTEMLGKNNEYGVIVENSEDGLYNGLTRILSDKDLLYYYQAKAKERASFFEPESTVGAVEKLFKEVMES